PPFPCIPLVNDIRPSEDDCEECADGAGCGDRWLLPKVSRLGSTRAVTRPPVRTGAPVARLAPKPTEGSPSECAGACEKPSGGDCGGPEIVSKNGNGSA